MIIKTEYSKCKEKIIDNYMKKYERGKLKNINEKIIKNRLQAIAIGLNMSEKICENKITKNDILNKEIKVNKMIFDKSSNSSFSSDKLQLSNVKNAIFLINYYKKHKQFKKYTELKNNLFSRALIAFGKNNLSINIYKEIKKII